MAEKTVVVRENENNVPGMSQLSVNTNIFVLNIVRAYNLQVTNEANSIYFEV